MKLHFVESMDEVLKIALERELVRPAACRSGEPEWSAAAGRDRAH